MIDPKTLSFDDVGKIVYYKSTYLNRLEEGVLCGWTDKYVFVRFKGPTGEACNPEDVSFSVSTYRAVLYVHTTSSHTLLTKESNDLSAINMFFSSFMEHIEQATGGNIEQYVDGQGWVIYKENEQ